jgi:hypothetical protein
MHKDSIIHTDTPAGALALDTETSVQIMDLIDESNPFTEEEEQKEIETLVAIEAALQKSLRKKFKRKSKNSIWTARNIWNKLAITLMVGIADSTGLIHVSSLITVLAGVHDYINNKLVDLLSSNPIKVGQIAIDLNRLID